MGVTFERLPPERRIVAPTAASAGSCCCCCCCCLHTVGSLVGALTAKAPKPPEMQIPTAIAGSAKTEPTYKITKEYWVTLLILCIVAFPIFLYIISEGDIMTARFGEWALAYALLLPGIQLVASIVCAVRNAMSKRPGKNERLSHLASITIRAFLGGLIGILVMAIVAAAL